MCGERAGKHSYYGGQVGLKYKSEEVYMEKVKPNENSISSKRCVPPAGPSSDAPCSPATTPRTSASRFVIHELLLIDSL